MNKVLLLLSVLLFVFFSCKKDETPAVTEFYGERVSVGNGQAWTYIQVDGQNNPISLGVQFDESALTNLPAGSMFPDEFFMKLPTEVSVAPFNHVTLDWNEHGHEPMEIYDLPHFDIHFYFLSEAQRDQIGPMDTIEFQKPIAPEFLPLNYLETPDGVPRMGTHMIDLESPEIAGTGVFTHTFIYGKYDAKINFLEPMVTTSFLESKENLEKEIRHPEQWQQEGYYPNKYTITYDASTKIHSILLENLVWQN
jgi:hypothetical protein